MNALIWLGRRARRDSHSATVMPIGCASKWRASLLQRRERCEVTILENSRRQGTAALQTQEFHAGDLECVARRAWKSHCYMQLAPCDSTGITDYN